MLGSRHAAYRTESLFSLADLFKYISKYTFKNQIKYDFIYHKALLDLVFCRDSNFIDNERDRAQYFLSIKHSLAL